MKQKKYQRMSLSYIDKKLKIKILHNKINYLEVHLWEYSHSYIIIPFYRQSLKKYGY